jgi:uncharacterized protein YndB with AHSA1/START domain
MTDRTVSHSSFTLERVYPVPPARVFAAFADLAKKSRWFGGGDDQTMLEHSLDFREGGRERAAGRWKSGMVSAFDAHYLDIVPDRRIVYCYVMHLDERRISVSLATIELLVEGAGTRIVVTEQGAFLDGYDDGGSRERGTAFLLDRLGASLAA